jgi:aryl-phospho-beta-D-glucosidase BglC (GH1 family)
MFNKLIFIFIHFLPSIISNKIRGTSLGSLFVIEPFINPSLFYPFLGNSERVISDSYSFCDYLGPYEANKRLKKHWSNWVNESTIQTLSKSGLNTLRIPVGDYMFIPYGPYAKVVSDSDYTTCFSGSVDYLDLIIDYAGKYGLKVIIDIHAWKDSQNGFDNSGQTKNLETYKLNTFDLKIDPFENMCKSMAKSAGIKYGKQLDEQEIQLILEHLFNCENSMYSPNGKLVMMEMSKLELDAFFKR